MAVAEYPIALLLYLMLKIQYNNAFPVTKIATKMTTKLYLMHGKAVRAQSVRLQWMHCLLRRSCEIVICIAMNNILIR